MKVSPPTFCPECRRQRRFAWFNLINLFHRNCDLCGEDFISVYPKELPYIVYCTECWYSDKWDFKDFGMDYDFSRPFFEQFNELLHKTPLLGLIVNANTITGFLYNNYATYIKNCYLTFNSDSSEECAFGSSITRSRESFSSSMVMDTQNCYDCMCIYKSNRVVGTRGNNRFCIDCYFIRDCENCQDCFMCSGLRNKKYCFKNKQLTKEEYEKKFKEYDLGSHKDYLKAQIEAESFWKTISPKPVWDTLSVNYSGSYVFHSKNCHECYDVVDSEDCKFCEMLWRKNQKSCYDVSCYGEDINHIYESSNIFEHAYNIKFSVAAGLNTSNVEYCKRAMSSQDCFGCVSIKRGKYSILNKEYSKEEYFDLKEKIIRHMDEIPYVDKQGRIYKYGEFFPIEISPFPYNITFANIFNPLNEDEIKNVGSYNFNYRKNEYKITKSYKDIPDNIKDVNHSILNEVIECEECSMGYKIIEMELTFLLKMNLPIPRKCPLCRVKEKLFIWVDNMHLKDRVCDICSKKFKTHFGQDRAPIIYCKDCYQKEFV
jgi:Zn ribbon nucleic-acid-binding protein